MDDITPATRRMTYAELAEARAITTGSAEQLARRRRWPRQLGNDGMVRVLVPFGEDRITPRHKGPTKSPDIGESIGGYEGPVSGPLHQGAMTVPVIGEVIGQAIRDAVDGLVTPLREQLEVANQRAQDDRKRADAAISTERDRADRAERRADGERATAEKLQAELIDLRVSERIADRAVAEVLELRQRLDQAATAERVARTEADDLRAVLDTRQQWGLARRLRWALRGR